MHHININAINVFKLYKFKKPTCRIIQLLIKLSDFYYRFSKTRQKPLSKISFILELVVNVRN